MSSLVFCLTLRLNLNSICLVFVESETPFDWLWPWVSPTVSRLFFSLYIYTYAYRYFIIYFLALTKPVPAWIPVKASFSTSDTIVTLYTYRSTNRFVSLKIWRKKRKDKIIWSTNLTLFTSYFQVTGLIKTKKQSNTHRFVHCSPQLDLSYAGLLHERMLYIGPSESPQATVGSSQVFIPTERELSCIATSDFV